MVALTPTPKSTIFREGTARLYRFRRPAAVPAVGGPPVLLIPSLINRWYILDLRSGFSVAEALVNAGLDVYCLDWGSPEDEDRYLTWEIVFRRLGRAVRVVKREAGVERLNILGYCMGGTLVGIYAALHPENVAGLINLAGPFDFDKAGFLGEMTDPRWFDPEWFSEMGNISPVQMQSGFVALRPTLQLSKWINLLDNANNRAFRDSFTTLETWANDNTPFPAAAYVTYIRELYQQNLLIKGEHHVAGRRVDLKNITGRVLTVIASKDTICPPDCATALNAFSGSRDQQVLTCPGGHVGAVVGRKAQTMLYPKLCEWLSPPGTFASA